MDMKHIRGAAQAYYANLSAEEKQSVGKLFNEMGGRNKQISQKEYIEYFKKKGKEDFTDPKIFRALDKDGNGSLNLDELITLYYIWHSGRVVSCKCCDSFLIGDYFSCVQCFCRDSGSTYDLCHNCYGGKTFKHHPDAIFCDNHTLLCQTRSIAQKAPAESKRQLLANIAAMRSLTSNAETKFCSIF